jgi:hypothetical protein
VPAGNGRVSGQWSDGGGGGNEALAAGSGLDRLVASKLQPAIDLLNALARRLSKAPKVVAPLAKKLPEFLVPKAKPGTLTGAVETLKPAERVIAEELKGLGNNLKVVKVGPNRTPEWEINGVRQELKTVSGVKDVTSDGISSATSSRIMDARGQAADILVNARDQTGMTREIAERAISRAFGADKKVGAKIESITVLTT